MLASTTVLFTQTRHVSVACRLRYAQRDRRQRNFSAPSSLIRHHHSVCGHAGTGSLLSARVGRGGRATSSGRGPESFSHDAMRTAVAAPPAAQAIMYTRLGATFTRRVIGHCWRRSQAIKLRTRAHRQRHRRHRRRRPTHTTSRCNRRWQRARRRVGGVTGGSGGGNAASNGELRSIKRGVNDGLELMCIGVVNDIAFVELRHFGDSFRPPQIHCAQKRPISVN